MIATSKTFKQLARLTGAPPQRKGPFAHGSVTARDLGHWIPQLAGMPARQRARLRGISQPRARQILAGAVVARAAMKALNVTKADVSPWALREGIIPHYLQTRLSDSLILPLRPLDQVTGEDDTAARRHAKRDRGSRYIKIECFFLNGWRPARRCGRGHGGGDFPPPRTASQPHVWPRRLG